MNGKNKMIAWIAGIIGVIILLIVVIVRIEPEKGRHHTGRGFQSPGFGASRTGKSVRPKQNSGKNPGFRSRNRITGL